MDVQLADVLSLGVEVGIVAVEPIVTAVGFPIGFGQDASDGAAAHVAVVGITQDLEGEVVEAPGRVGLLMIFGLATGERNDVQAFVGGKNSGGDRSGVRLGVRPSPV